jgi:hypothetical protein
MSNRYTNTMRRGIRTLKNPTAIPVDIVQQKEYIELRVDPVKFERLAIKTRMNFIAYVNAIADIIESEGSRAMISGIKV